MTDCEKMGTVPSAGSTIADFKGFGEPRSGLSPIFSQPLRERLPLRCDHPPAATPPASRLRLVRIGERFVASTRSSGRGDAPHLVAARPR